MRQLFIHFERFVETLTDAAGVAGGILVGIMTMVVSYAVIGRYILNRPIGWSEEIAIYLMIWAVFLGAAYTFKKDAHIGVDLLLNNLSKRGRKIFHGLHYVIALLFLSVLFYKGIEQVQLSLMLENRSLDLNFPIFLVQSAVPVGAILLILQVIVKLLRLILRIEPPGTKG